MAQPSIRSTRLFCGLFILMGVGAIGAGGWILVQGLRCEFWPTTDGVIQTAEMNYHSGNHGGVTYSADVTYKYQVAGVNYTGTRLAFGQMSSSSEYARRILDRYPVGQKVSVHYSPGKPEQAVLETGIHGGTWLCLGVGTVFVLAGVMAMQLLAARPTVPGKAGTPPPATSPDDTGRAGLQKPPILMGVIFVLMGSFVFFMEPSRGVPAWIVYAAGGFFVLCGLLLLAYRLQNQLFSKIMMWLVVLIFLAIFHWISFAPGERTGTATTPFSHTTRVGVKMYFAAVTVLIDLAILAGLVKWLTKGRKD
jgi:Protein of unknown function (DUF3592)